MTDTGCLSQRATVGNLDGVTHTSIIPKQTKTLLKGKIKEIAIKSLRVYRPDILVQREDLPHHLQFNPYIYSGYRPLLSIWGSLQSLFYIHNESVNIFTHGIPMLYIFMFWKTFLPWNQITVPYLPWSHLVSIVSPWIGSTFYHLFMNHNSGAKCYKFLLHLDMFGIWITQSFGAVTTVYTSVACLPITLISIVMLVYFFVSLWCLYKALVATNAISRRFCFSFAVVMQLCVLSWRMMPYGGGSSQATYHYIIQDVTAVVGGLLGAFRVPERWVHGKLDMFANSHHIMHVIVLYAVYHLHQGAVLDLIWLSEKNSCVRIH